MARFGQLWYGEARRGGASRGKVCQGEARCGMERQPISLKGAEHDL